MKLYTLKLLGRGKVHFIKNVNIFPIYWHVIFRLKQITTFDSSLCHNTQTTSTFEYVPGNFVLKLINNLSRLSVRTILRDRYVTKILRPFSGYVRFQWMFQQIVVYTTYTLCTKLSIRKFLLNMSFKSSRYYFNLDCA